MKLTAFAERLAEVTRAMIDQAIQSVRTKQAEIETAVIARLDALETRFAALPVPEKGEPGKDGKDGRDGVDAKDGAPGKDGVDGEKGDPGKDGKDADMEIVARLIDERVAAEVEKRVAALPKAKDGESVHPDTIALMVREAADKLVAALPKPKDGSDGFGLEDFDVELGEDGRTLSLRFVRGEVKVERQVRLASIIDRGVYRPETKYEKGDGVTWAGSWWIAQVDHPTDKPGISEQWRLAVKRGRDGKDK